MSTATLSSGEISYVEQGTGPAVVFVHGLLVNGALWRKVLPEVAAAGFRCIAPDWPLGAHKTPMSADADLTPPGVARLIAEFLEALELTDVTIVANDTGGALTQILMVNHPERIGRVVLTPCDAFEEFFPKPFDRMPNLARIPGAIWLASYLLQLPAVQQQPNAFGWLAKRGIPADILKSYVQPMRDSAEIRRDATRFIGAVDNKYTLAAATKLADFTKPVLLVRAADDRIFKPHLFDRLAATLPNATIVTVEDSWSFIPEDQPHELSRRIVEFAS
ncbi:alpha/beta fold hydrolase [Kribbella sp. NPDC056951]|uniref:alpha/beta fold hydrolase n=1 Tax=Kribbella sp. NPDC056951 TaxID=3345978 RepID=UPI0036338D2E